MVFDSLENFDKYLALNPYFKSVSDFIKENDLDNLEPGKHDINENVFVISETVEGKEKSAAVVESHRKFIDVQLCRNSIDNMGWLSIEECTDVKEDLLERDLIFYNNKPAKHFEVGPDNFVIFFPWDGHAPNIGKGELKKIIFKIRVQS
ncbi:MAG: YhcH/YjgK/YiaL family protein [Lentisphaeraceae bacterium]|nr:YhcH/YjgK/YiaL family protein [Lentisphaeraceae bacterium]